MATPSQLHQELLIELCSIIRDHIHKRNGTCKAIPAPFDVKLESDKDNIVQPDISVICDKEKLDGKIEAFTFADTANSTVIPSLALSFSEIMASLK